MAAVFATCEVGFIKFIIAAILSLPIPIAFVYIGVAFGESGLGTATTESNAVSGAIAAIIAIVTVISVRYIYRRMQAIKGDVVYRRRKSRYDQYAVPCRRLVVC